MTSIYLILPFRKVPHCNFYGSGASSTQKSAAFKNTVLEGRSESKASTRKNTAFDIYKPKTFCYHFAGNAKDKSYECRDLF